MIRTTHTYAILEVSKGSFEEIKVALELAGYEDNAFYYSDEGLVIDMHGIALQEKKEV